MCSRGRLSDLFSVQSSVFVGTFQSWERLKNVFLFQMAFSLADGGSNVYYVTKKPMESFHEEFKKFLVKPEVLERIHFKYLNSAADIVMWSQRLHTFVRKPTVIIVEELNKFVNLNDFNSYRLCSALLDAANHCSASHSGKLCYLVVTISSPIESLSVQLIMLFFNNVWHIDGANQLLNFSEVRKHPFQNKFLKVKFKTLSDVFEFDPLPYILKKKSSS